MTTYEKLDLLAKLYIELAEEFEERALLLDNDKPLNRMLIEHGSSRFRNDYKNLHTSGDLENFKMRLRVADREISKIEN